MLSPLPPVEKFTNPKRVIRRDHLLLPFAQPDGSWGRYKTAKRFDSAEKAFAFARQYGYSGYEVYPISKPKALTHKS